MTGKNDFSTVTDQMLNSGDSSSDPCIISNFLAIIKRDIKVSPDKHLLALEIRRCEIANAFLGHGYDAPHGFGRGTVKRSHLGGHVIAKKRVNSRGGESQATDRCSADEMGGGGIEVRPGSGG